MWLAALIVVLCFGAALSVLLWTFLLGWLRGVGLLISLGILVPVAIVLVLGIAGVIGGRPERCVLRVSRGALRMCLRHEHHVRRYKWPIDQIRDLQTLPAPGWLLTPRWSLEVVLPAGRALLLVMSSRLEVITWLNSALREAMRFPAEGPAGRAVGRDAIAPATAPCPTRPAGEEARVPDPPVSSSGVREYLR